MFHLYTILLSIPSVLLLTVQVPQWIFLISPKKQQIIILLGRSPAVKQSNELMSTKNARKPEMCFIFITCYNGPLMGLSSRDWIGCSKGLLVDYISYFVWGSITNTVQSSTAFRILPYHITNVSKHSNAIIFCRETYLIYNFHLYSTWQGFISPLVYGSVSYLMHLAGFHLSCTWQGFIFPVPVTVYHSCT
jgi:hypothetical protein